MQDKDSPSDAPASPPRGRRRKSARPDEILAAAIAEFYDHGYGATRITDIARRANVAKGTVYLYYDTKQAIFEAAMNSVVAPTLDQIETLLDSFDGPTDALLEMMIRKVYQNIVQSDARVTLRIIIGEGHLFPELRQYHYDKMLRQGVAIMQRVLNRGIERGDFRAGPSRAEPRVIMAPAIVAGIWLMCFDEFDPIDLDRYIAAHLDLVLNGLRT